MTEELGASASGPGCEASPSAASGFAESHPSRGVPWLHIRSQFTYHSEADIRGTLGGLESLRDALNAAIEAGAAQASAMASDGEGYRVVVTRCRDIRGLGKTTYLDNEARELAYRERDYLVRYSKSIEKQHQEALTALRWCRANGNPHLRDSDRNPQGEKPQALSAEHESAGREAASLEPHPISRSNLFPQGTNNEPE